MKKLLIKELFLLVVFGFIATVVGLFLGMFAGVITFAGLYVVSIIIRLMGVELDDVSVDL